MLRSNEKNDNNLMECNFHLYAKATGLVSEFILLTLAGYCRRDSAHEDAWESVDVVPMSAWHVDGMHGTRCAADMPRSSRPAV